MEYPCGAFVGIYGQLLDRAGRKMIMTVAILGYLLYFSTISIAMTKTQHYFELVLLSSFVAGCMGGFNSFTMAMFAYATDITMVEGGGEGGGGGGGDGKSRLL
jgi:MFS family permease